ncbi:MAG TPA: AMP-binding protein [Devosiaceae bacterium]
MPSARQFYEMLEQSQFWPQHRLVGWQRQQLSLLLNHARTTSPYYRFRLNKAVRPNGTIDWDRWTEIPILSRADLMNHFDRMLSRAPVQEHAPFADLTTSGSTGHPVTIRTTAWLNTMAAACNWRAQRWAGLDWSKDMVVVAGRQDGVAAGDALGPWGPPWLGSARKGRTIYATYSTPMDELLEILARTRARYLATTPNGIEILAARARALACDIRLDAIVARGGKTTPFVRSQARETFGAEVIETYASKECGAIAAPCSTGAGYHVNAESMLVEIVDEDGRPVEEGETGRLVITPFGSTALPLIRYDQGDTAVAGRLCACERTLPAFASIHGRQRHNFIAPGGRVIENLPLEARKLLGAGQWQEVQVGPTHFRINYVSRDWGTPRDEAAFMKIFRDVFFDGATVELVEVEEMPLSENGKYLERVVAWKAPDSGQGG